MWNYWTLNRRAKMALGSTLKGQKMRSGVLWLRSDLAFEYLPPLAQSCRIGLSETACLTQTENQSEYRNKSFQAR